MGLAVSGRAKAYPFETITGQPVLNDHFAGEDIVVAFDPTSESGAAFSRRVDGRTLSFEAGPSQRFTSGPASQDGQPGSTLMQDRETGSRWLSLTGQAIDGPLQWAVARAPPQPLLLLVRLDGFSSKVGVVWGVRG